MFRLNFNKEMLKIKMSSIRYFMRIINFNTYFNDYFSYYIKESAVELFVTVKSIVMGLMLASSSLLNTFFCLCFICP